MFYSMCTYLQGFRSDRNSILCSLFWHGEIIQQSLQFISDDLQHTLIPFMSAAIARSMSSLAWG